MLAGTAQRGLDSSALKSMLAADPKYLESFFNTIDSKYGSMDNFLHEEMELSKEKIAKLKGLYLE